ncbi:MAG: hypothetical protein KKI08_04740 [Armatimonadetes bacterium]|nr:hypothetical protein [Armatimonadota bacterium]
MRRLWSVVAVMLCVCAWGADLVKNGDFAQEVAGQPAQAADWTLPADGSWQRVVGADGKAALQCQAKAGVVGPARGRCDFLSPKSGYTIAVSYEGDGKLTPTVRVMDLPDSKALGQATGSRKAGPQKMGLSFGAISADVGIEIYADAAHMDGKEGPAGTLRLTGVTVFATGSEPPEKLPDIGPNLALNKPYTMSPAPSYALCKDPGDAMQLTDGVYTQGHFWTRPTTVGWGSRMVFITIDLGRDQPLKGVSYNTAAGVAQVHWPQRILIFVSPDGQQWYDVGNLVTLSAPHNNLPEYGQYAIRHLWTDQLKTHGRYVCLCVEPEYGGYVFVDEIEVFGGPADFAQVAYAGKAFANPQERMKRSIIDDLLRAQFRRALEAVREDIAALPKDAQAKLTAAADGLAGRIDPYEAPDMEGFRAVLPVCPLEADIFKLQAAVWRAARKPTLRVWNLHRWEMLDSFSEPAEGPNTGGRTAGIRPIEVHLMNNETRAGVVNLTNAGDSDLRVRVRVTGLPGGDTPPYLQVHEVLTVGTRWFVPVSSALPEAKREGKDAIVTVPCGTTRQVWLSFKPENLPAKTYSGQIEITPAVGNKQTVPLKLVVYPLRFPDQTTLCLGGWDYTDADAMYGITVENRAAVVEHLQDHLVNTPWAGGSVMWAVQVDDNGQIKEPVDTTRFDNWVKLWPDARRYMVFLNCGQQFGGSKIGEQGFGLKVGAWARFWAQHMRELGKQPEQLGVLIYDEPHNKQQYDLIVAWANAIEAAAPELTTFEDPQPTEYVDAPVMFEAVDLLCPYRTPYLDRDQKYRDMFLNAGKQGKELWFYNASGPARSFDPFSFYLVQAWHAFAIGGKGSHFWAFGDNGRVSCWNEYPAEGNGPYCPSYLDQTSVTTSKYMEAVRESAEDFEYLTMLQARVAELKQKGVSSPALAAAEKLLAEGPQRVMAGEQGSNYRWDVPKDRAVQDQVRIEVLKALAVLPKP